MMVEKKAVKQCLFNKINLAHSVCLNNLINFVSPKYFR